jgi:hypothetical protein
MGDKTASRLGCSPDWEQRESEGAGELPRMGAKTASRLGCGPDWEQMESEGARELLAYWVAVMNGN